MSPDIQGSHKDPVLEGRTRRRSSCPPPASGVTPAPPQLSEPGETVNSHTGHWVSVEALRNLQHIHGEAWDEYISDISVVNWQQLLSLQLEVK